MTQEDKERIEKASSDSMLTGNFIIGAEYEHKIAFNQGKIEGFNDGAASRQKEIDELKTWKQSQIETWLPIIEFCQDNAEKLGLKVGDSISEFILNKLKNHNNEFNYGIEAALKIIVEMDEFFEPPNDVQLLEVKTLIKEIENLKKPI